jgi:hypothetical protein
MAVIPESKREKYLGLLSRCIVGESLKNLQDQEAIMGIFWSPFERIYGVNPIHIYHGAPVTQEFVDALAEDLGFSVGRSQVVEEDLWL